jgi:succinate dehydrogenase / fumarate reductase membrane anchor subunit
MNDRQRGTEGWGWLMQALTGILLIVLLGLHMVANHFIVEGGLRTYADVLAYVSDPIIIVLEIAFLLAVTYHALLGLRAVIFDLGLSAAQERGVTAALTVLGLVMIGYGIWLALTLASA